MMGGYVQAFRKKRVIINHGGQKVVIKCREVSLPNLHT